MKKRFYFLFVLLGAFAALPMRAQHRHCSTAERWHALAAQDQGYAARRAASEAQLQNWMAAHPQANKTASLITIPVVVHVLYKNSAENISNAQIQSQIDVLNEDFRLLNPDSLANNHPFWGVTADCEIEFCLASFDPNGNATTGITRTPTNVQVFSDANDNAKFTSLGGIDNWDPTHYLNIWVCDLGSQLFGYATFPSDLAASPDYDGVVINFTAFGVGGTTTSPSDLGRTASHEIGHWLDLSHIWGDQTCGDDLVADTEPAEQENYGCPSFPSNPNNSCGGGPNGEMYMNYMDYTDDNCMAMFTAGQKARMHAALNGDRSAILSSAACAGPTVAPAPAPSAMLQVFPNPTTGKLVIGGLANGAKGKVTVVNTLGTVVARSDDATTFPKTLDLSALPNAVYILKVEAGNALLTQKIVLQH
jgi:hypothetical protein